MLPLVEKYRPVEFNDIVGIDIKFYNELLKSPESIPNILLYGSSGTGKSTTLKTLLNKLSPIDVLKINGSDETGVDVFRTKVFNFVSSRSTTDKPKIVWIEECDYLSNSSFAILRSMIETYSKNARFFCSCNYINKIPEPIQSRFCAIEFKRLSKEDILKTITLINEKEKLIDAAKLPLIAETSNGDLRLAINSLQKKEETKEDMFKFVTSCLETGLWSKIRFELPQTQPNYIDLLIKIDNHYFYRDIPTEKKIAVNEIVSDALFKMNFSFSKEITFMSACSKLIKVLLD